MKQTIFVDDRVLQGRNSIPVCNALQELSENGCSIFVSSNDLKDMTKQTIRKIEGMNYSFISNRRMFSRNIVNCDKKSSWYWPTIEHNLKTYFNCSLNDATLIDQDPKCLENAEKSGLNAVLIDRRESPEDLMAKLEALRSKFKQPTL